MPPTGRPPVGREPLPRLVVVVDELKALVDEVPRFLEGLVRLAALGRSLGVHLVLASQRPTGALSAEVRANINLRIAFRVRDRTDSVDVVDDVAAAGIDPGLPGRGLARGGDGALVPFQAAMIGRRRRESAPFLSVALVKDGEAAPRGLARRQDHPVRGTDAGGPDDALAEAVALVAAAAGITGRLGVRRPWLMPLPDRVPAVVDDGGGFEVVAGLVDEPDRQRLSLLACGAETGTQLVSGPPRSGRTTAARALLLAAVGVRSPAELHVHVIDPSGALRDLAALPHVGTVIGPGDRRGLAALLDHLDGLTRTRRASGAGGERPDAEADASRGDPETIVVVDGWDQLAEASASGWPDPMLDRLLAALRDGGASGLRGIITGGRALLQPKWSGTGGTVLLLGRVDPLEAALTGLRHADLPTNPVPGRGVRITDRREVQVAAADARTTQEVAERSVGDAPPLVLRPWRHRPLPESAGPPTVGLRARCEPDRDAAAGCAGVGRHVGRAAAVVVDPAPRGAHPARRGTGTVGPQHDLDHPHDGAARAGTRRPARHPDEHAVPSPAPHRRPAGGRGLGRGGPARAARRSRCSSTTSTASRSTRPFLPSCARSVTSSSATTASSSS